MQQTTFLRIRAAIARAGISRSTFYALIRKGLWPTPIALGPRSRAFPDYEVELMNQARVAGKTDDEIRDLVRQLIAARRSVEVSNEPAPDEAEGTVTTRRASPRKDATVPLAPE